MDIYAATEIAYKNGYKKGFEDGQAAEKSKIIKDKMIWIVPKINKPNKFTYEGDVEIKLDNNYDITISRKATLEEVSNWLGVDIKDILDGKIGYYVLEEIEDENESK